MSTFEPPTSLSAFASNVASQFGEDGIIAEIFRRIGERSRTCVEFGAWDGKHLSNTWDLWHNKGWRAILIEGEPARAAALRASLTSFPQVEAIEAYVEPQGDHTLDNLLRSANAPGDIDLLSIDIDGDEYHVWRSLEYTQPRVVVVEYNPTIPPHLDLVQLPGGYFGASALALTKLAHEKGYKLACCTETNCIFVREVDHAALGFLEPALEDVFPMKNLCYVINAYDGATFLSKTPTYSPRPQALGVKTLLSELRDTLRHPDAHSTRRDIAAGILMPVRVFEKPADTFRKPVLDRVTERFQDWVFTSKAWLHWQFLKQRLEKKLAEQEVVRDWKRAGSAPPPPHILKQRTIRRYARWFRRRVLVETGTYRGDMVAAMQGRFDKIFSVELSPELHRDATIRFASDPSVEIVQGDSGTVLPAILSKLTQPALFWLDGHYSAGVTAKGSRETPILAELDAIATHRVRGHVILIDDARCFDGTHDYPTMEALEAFVKARIPNARFSVRNDIIRIRA